MHEEKQAAASFRPHRSIPFQHSRMMYLTLKSIAYNVPGAAARKHKQEKKDFDTIHLFMLCCIVKKKKIARKWN